MLLSFTENRDGSTRHEDLWKISFASPRDYTSEHHSIPNTTYHNYIGREREWEKKAIKTDIAASHTRLFRETRENDGVRVSFHLFCLCVYAVQNGTESNKGGSVGTLLHTRVSLAIIRRDWWCAALEWKYNDSFSIVRMPKTCWVAFSSTHCGFSTI